MGNIKFLRDDVYCEEVGECPNKPDTAVFEVGCNKKNDYIYFVSSRNEDIDGLADWLADMICDDCTHMCENAQKRFDCCYFGRDFSAIAELNAEMLAAEDRPF